MYTLLCIFVLVYTLCRKTVPSSLLTVPPGRVEGTEEDFKNKTKQTLYFRRAQKEPSTLTAQLMWHVCVAQLVQHWPGTLRALDLSQTPSKLGMDMHVWNSEVWEVEADKAT